MIPAAQITKSCTGRLRSHGVSGRRGQRGFGPLLEGMALSHSHSGQPPPPPTAQGPRRFPAGDRASDLDWCHAGTGSADSKSGPRAARTSSESRLGLENRDPTEPEAPSARLQCHGIFRWACGLPAAIGTDRFPASGSGSASQCQSLPLALSDLAQVRKPITRIPYTSTWSFLADAAQ